MKRNICTMFCLLLSVLLVFSLAACQDSSNDPVVTPTSSATEPTQPTQPTEPPYMPASAAELWDKVDAAMEALESAETDATLTCVYYNSGYKFNLESVNFGVTTKESFYAKTTTKVTCTEASVEQNVTTLSAYHDGKMYYAYNDGVYEQVLCSAATKEEFAQTQSSGLLEDVKLAECTGGKFTKNGEDGWTIEFSGYSKKTVTAVLDALSIASDMLGTEIEDMKILVETDAAFQVKTLKLDFIFAEEDGSATPEFSAITNYSKHNAATFADDLLDPEEYVEVNDLFILDTYVKELEAHQNATNGHFVLDLNQTVRYYGQTTTSTETDLVTYGKKNGAYYYSVLAELNGTEATLVYQNGTQTYTYAGETYSAYMTDAEAKQTIAGLIDSAMFDARAVTDIENQGDGVYLLTCSSLDLTAYSASVTEGITLEFGEQVIKVIFKDGKLVKIESKVNLEGKYEYNDIELTIKSVVDFEKEADYPTV